MKVPIVKSEYVRGKGLVRTHYETLPWVRKDLSKLKFFGLTPGEFRELVWERKEIRPRSLHWDTLRHELEPFGYDADPITTHVVAFMWAGLKPVFFKTHDEIPWSRWPKSWRDA